MRVYGLDFTSRPSRQKPITCAVCLLKGNVVVLEGVKAIHTFDEFEVFLRSEGTWVAGIDAPFGQPRELISNLELRSTWSQYVSQFASFGKAGFINVLTRYKAARPTGHKEHKRHVDDLAAAISPMKLSFVPVGKMFFELAPRLLASNVSVPPLRPRNDPQVVVEAYPGLLIRELLGRLRYKHDTAARQSPQHQAARRHIVDVLGSSAFTARYHLTVSLSQHQQTLLIADPKGDCLDALLAALQAAWASTQPNWGMPQHELAKLEGWIADPALRPPAALRSEV